MRKTTSTFFLDLCEPAMRLALDHKHEHPPLWAVIISTAAKIGCTAQTLNEWVKKTAVDVGKRAGVPTEMMSQMKGDLSPLGSDDLWVGPLRR
jgi:transposase